MRRLLTWVAGAAGGLAAYKAATRRTVEPETEPVAAEADPAEELRARLAQARADEPEPQGPDARRREVHEQARAAIDEMRDQT